MKGVSGPIIYGALAAIAFGAVAGAVVFFVMLALVAIGVALTFATIAKRRP